MYTDDIVKINEHLASDLHHDKDVSEAWYRIRDVYEKIMVAANENFKSNQQRQQEICHWNLESIDDYHYETECDKSWHFPDGTAQENGLVFCPHCGKHASVR